MVSEILTRSAASFGATRMETITKVVIPAALPAIVAGLQLAVGRALMGAVIAELFIGSQGLGFRIGFHSGFLRLDDVFLGIFILGALGVALREVVSAIHKRVNYKE